MTETTFSVGDKVRHPDYGTGEITYGPFISYGTAKYLVKDDAGNEAIASPQYLEAVSKFAIGDKVTGANTGAAYEIVGGPFKGSAEAWYATQHGRTGVVVKNPESALRAVVPPAADDPIKAGDRVRVTKHRADGARVSVGDEFTVKRLSGARGLITDGGNFGSGWHFSLSNVEKVTADTHTHKGVTYDLSAKYKDCDGDVWQFSRVNGTVRGGIGRPAYDYSETLTEVVDSYGPMTKI